MNKAELRIVIVAGARPNFMKVAPIIQEIRRRFPLEKQRISYRLVHTGQHYDEKMSGLFFAELGIPAPDFNLEVGSASHAMQTARIMSRFEPVCEKDRPDWVVVVGDVNSTLACTLVCAKMGIKVVHVEAGLRSFDRSMPEEINRIVTDALADLLLTPSQDAEENLMREGIPQRKVRFVGNVMIDSLMTNLTRARSSKLLEQLGVSEAEFVYVTLHRPSNVDHPEVLASVMQQLRSLANAVPVVFPMHPRTRKTCEQHGISVESVQQLFVLDPIGYHDSLFLTEKARFVLTDSGGLQEESTFFRTPCLTLRANTERPVTVSIGSNRLTSTETLADDLRRYCTLPRRIGEIPPLWDGHAACRIVDAIVSASNLERC